MSDVNHIIDSLGGTTCVATAMGLWPSVVHGWREANSIPRWRHQDILALAISQGVALSTADFPTREQRTPKARAA